MFSRLTSILHSPHFSDPDDLRVAKTLHIILIASIAMSGYFLINGLLFSGDQIYRHVVLTMMIVGLFFLVRKLHEGYIRPISYVLPAFLWSLITILVFMGNGIQGLAFVTYIAIIIIVGIVVNWRMALFTTVLTIAASGIYVFANGPDLSVRLWVSMSIFFLAIVLLIKQTVEDLIDARNRLRDRETSLRGILSNSSDFVARFEKEQNQIYVTSILNPAERVRLEDFTDNTGQALSEADRFALWNEYIRKVFLSGEGINFELSKDINDQIQHLHIRLTPEKNNRGNVESVLGVVHDVTDIKQVQEQVYLHSLALEHSLNGFDIVGEDGLFVYVNKAYVKMWGYDTAEEIIGTSPAEHCADPETPGEIVSNTLEHGEYQLEFVGKRKDGSNFDVLMDVRSLTMANGKTIFFGSSEDITERNHAKKLLERQQEQQTILAEASHALTQTLDLDTILKTLLTYLKMLVPYDTGTVMFVEGNSVAVFEVAGFEPYAVPDDVKLIRFEIDETPAIQHVIRKRDSLRIADTHDFEGWKRTKVAHHIVSWMGVPLVNDDVVIGLFSVSKTSQDFFTDEHQNVAETLASFGSTGISNARFHAQIVQERNRLRTLIDNIPDYVFIKDREGRFVETNVAHAAAANLSREDMLTHTASEVFEPDLAMQFHEDDHEVLETGAAIINEERITQDAMGEKRWVLTTKVPLFDEDQNVIGLVGISRDITKHRLAEEDRMEAERLRLEVEKTRQVIELKQRFIQTASHDFRTPLTIIKSSAAMLQDYHDRLTPDRREVKLTQIQDQVDHMVHLIDQVLVISRADAGELTIAPKVIDVKALCQRIWDDMVEIDALNHDVDFQYGTEVTSLYADQQLLEYALVNLISNAFKYTQAGGRVQFLISNNGQNMIFKVSDGGCGIPLADQKRILEPFFRATNTASISGTGLGLAITKTYIELHGGTIGFESAEGKGTTFTICLPVISPVNGTSMY